MCKFGIADSGSAVKYVKTYFFNLYWEVQTMHANYKTPTIISLVSVAIYTLLMIIWNPIYQQLRGLAGAIALNEDTIAGNTFLRLFRDIDWVSLVLTGILVVILIFIWRKRIPNIPFSILALVVITTLLLTGCATRAANESEGTFRDDVVTIKPNQTAFQIPATGANKSGQQQFGSIEYLQQQKVPAKRVTIEKELVGGKYMPSSFVILVDRTPVARSWTGEAGTGTVAKDESLCSESKTGENVCFQIAMAAGITEADAATYLYWFPTTKMQDEQIGGVFVATPLSEVVDVQVHQFLLAELGARTATRSLKEIMADKNTIIGDADKKAIEKFALQGITIAYVGIGGPIKVDPEIQAIINKLYIAQQEVEIAKLQATQVAIKAGADAAAIKILSQAVDNDPEALAKVLESYKWNGSRVTVMLAPDTGAVAIPLPTVAPTATAAPCTSQGFR